MLNSNPMTTSEGLGFGTQVSLTGVYADAETLGDRDALTAVLTAMVGEVEQSPQSHDLDAQLAVVGDDLDGLSGCLIKGETVAQVHTFTSLRTVTLQLFSAHDISLSTTTKQFIEAYSVGRFESSVRAYGRYPRRDEQALKTLLLGEREYARLRVAPQPAVSI